MSRRNMIIYWGATLWLALGMISTAVVQLIPLKEEVEAIKELGYPQYVLGIIGVCKLLGIIVVLLPRIPLLKEWAYAGFFFLMLGAAISHVVSGDSIGEVLPAVLLLLLIFLSWSFRPPSRKISQN